MRFALLFLLLLAIPVLANNFDVMVGVRIDKTNVSCSWDASQVCDFVNQSNDGLLIDCGTLSNMSVNNCSFEYGFTNIDFANSSYQYQHQNDMVTTITRNFPFDPICEGNYTECNFTLDDIQSAVANGTCFNDSTTTCSIDYDKIKGLVDAKSFVCSTTDISPWTAKAQESLDKCESARETCANKTCSYSQTIPIIILIALGLGFAGTIYLLMRGGE